MSEVQETPKVELVQNGDVYEAKEENEHVGDASKKKKKKKKKAKTAAVGNKVLCVTPHASVCAMQPASCVSYCANTAENLPVAAHSFNLTAVNRLTKFITVCKYKYRFFI